MKIHLYWAMKNCSDSPSKLQELIMNIPCHYQVHLHIHRASLAPQQALHITIIIIILLLWQCTYNCVMLCTCHDVHTCMHTQGQHSKCPSTSPCHTPAYTPSKIKLDNEKAIESLRQQLKSTYIYRSAEDFCRVSTTRVRWDYCFMSVYCSSVVTPTG